MSRHLSRLLLPSRRQLLYGAAGATALAAFGCGRGKGAETSRDSGRWDTGELPDLGNPEVSADLWQTMAAYARVSADRALGTRINLFNPADVPHRVVVQVIASGGILVAREVVSEAFPGGHCEHIELADLLDRHGVPLPFEGSVWVGAAPESGDLFMGLQGIVFDWYGPAHLASVHGLRDFGNSNGDGTWTDLILPKAVRTDRYVTKVAILNGSGDGISEALYATPEVILRDDDGRILAQTELDPLAPYANTLVAVDDLPGAAGMTIGTLQIREPEAALVAFAFLVDRDNDGFVSADHFFDRHFVVHATGFVG